MRLFHFMQSNQIKQLENKSTDIWPLAIFSSTSYKPWEMIDLGKLEVGVLTM